MRYLLPFAIVCLAACAKQEEPKPEVRKEGEVAFATQEITGKNYQFHIPAAWKPYDMTSKQFDDALQKTDVGEDPEKSRAMLKKAKENKVIQFMAFADFVTNKFAPNVNVVVIPNKETDLKPHLEGAKRHLTGYGKIVKSEIDPAIQAAVVEAEIMAGSPPQPVRMLNITKVNDKVAVSLNYSYLPSQAERLKQAIDIGKKSLKLR